ncbi:MAG: HEAT repeat domain-containing protein [Chloroflexi bacterium]|nr:HEAT repeat domain-containing protein [Chloroflexota bacterium]
MDWLLGKKDDSKKWIAQLKDSAKHAQAVQELVRLGPAAVDGLLDAISADATLRPLAKQILVQIGAPAIPRLSQALASAHPEVRMHVADVLGETRNPASLPALTSAARGEFFTVRARAAAALAKIGDAQSLSLLIQLLKDKENIVRMAAASAVVKFQDPRWLVPLSDVLLEDPQIEVRQVVASAMSESRNPQTIPYLIEALQDSFWWYERQDNAAAPLTEALASFSADAVEPLIQALRHPEGAVRKNAASILGMIRDPRAIEPLGMALYDFHVDVGEQAASALGLFGAASLEIFDEALRASESSIRIHALTGLGLVRDPRAIELIAYGLRDPDRQVQKHAIFALKVSRHPRALEILNPLAADRNDREFSMLAREALETLAKTIRK